MPKNDRAALYCRSSKDRSDVSIDAQRRELMALAAGRGLTVVAEYTDVVESGSDHDRPGFQKLITDLRRIARGWSTLLLLDTARLARRRYLAIVFEHEAEKHGIAIVYKSLPEDVDPITAMLLKSILQAMDEWHSLTSKQKGLAGMAENVRQGYRAGGRAPRGYQLRKVTTGAVRDGAPVQKSVLELGNDADIVRRYLEGRARGRSREGMRAELGLSWPATSLVDMEWNALTYAGNTVWNVANEFHAGQGYKGGVKRRPRAEWIVQPDTHPALITASEAEAIITAIETSRRSKGRRAARDHLLTGLLKTPDGEPWYANGRTAYRTKPASGRGRYVQSAAIEGAVIVKVTDDMQSTAFIRALIDEAHLRTGGKEEDRAGDVRRQVADLGARISRILDLVAGGESDAAPLLRKVDELESTRRNLITDLDRAEQEQIARRALSDLTEERVRALLSETLVNMLEADRGNLKDLLRTIVERIELDPVTLECRIHYRIGIESRNSLASPRGSGPIPVLRLVSLLRVA